jgi:hypothetical protein
MSFLAEGALLGDPFNRLAGMNICSTGAWRRIAQRHDEGLATWINWAVDVAGLRGHWGTGLSARGRRYSGMR